MDMPGPGTVFLSQNWKFTAPVFIDDTITAEAEVISKHETKPVTQLKIKVTRQDGETVLEGERPGVILLLLTIKSIFDIFIGNLEEKIPHFSTLYLFEYPSLASRARFCLVYIYSITSKYFYENNSQSKITKSHKRSARIKTR